MIRADSQHRVMVRKFINVSGDLGINGWRDTLRTDPCSYCSHKVGGSVDHIIPKSAGGSPHWENLTGACKRCNAKKRELPLLMFLMSIGGLK